jgi:hypothetical protein
MTTDSYSAAIPTDQPEQERPAAAGVGAGRLHLA